MEIKHFHGVHFIGLDVSINLVNRFRYYCTLGAKIPTPPGDETGGECPAGSYCNSGSSKPTPCSTGMACTIDGLENPDQQCAAGESKGIFLSLILWKLVVY